MKYTSYKIFLFLLIIFFAGCAASEKETGSEITDSLGINSKTLEETEKSIEKIYDAKTLLKRAGAYYERKEYIEAIGEYQRFLELHPVHELADYALFRIGMSHFRQIGAIDRDPSPMYKAIEVFQRVTSEYPRTQYAKDAELKIKELRERVSRYQLYIGKFYLKKKSYKAAIYRFQKIVEEFKEFKSAEDASYYLAIAYEKTGNNTDAREIIKKMITEYPDTKYRDKIERLLSRIRESM
ncbi:MAG: outer membrane protein assembly factor BamD [Nitrospirota bacterium]